MWYIFQNGKSYSLKQIQLRVANPMYNNLGLEYELNLIAGKSEVTLLEYDILPGEQKINYTSVASVKECKHGELVGKYIPL